jgi:hypothetical protein
VVPPSFDYLRSKISCAAYNYIGHQESSERSSRKGGDMYLEVHIRIHVALCEIVDFVRERYFGENFFAKIEK